MKRNAPLGRHLKIAGDLLTLAAIFVLMAALRKEVGLYACEIHPRSLLFLPSTSARMSVKGGVLCPIFLRSAPAYIDRLEVTAPPQHGAIVARGRTGVIYRSERGFRGDDTFTFVLRDTGVIHRHSAQVQVSVKVH